jgi:hypothetical protein
VAAILTLVEPQLYELAAKLASGGSCDGCGHCINICLKKAMETPMLRIAVS